MIIKSFAISSQRRFAHIEDEIREDFTFKPEVQKLCKEIWKVKTDEGHTEAIALHVRRTDPHQVNFPSNLPHLLP